MINILIPLGGKSSFFNQEEYPYPKPVIEIDGVPMIQLVLENYIRMREEKRFIFLVKDEDCYRFHLDEILQLLTDGQCIVVRMSGDTKGAVCSALLAIDHIDNDDELIIVNGDQVIDVNVDEVIASFRKNSADGGVICFSSVHPKWSYARLDEHGHIIETAEKRPISKNAIAGFYYYRTGADFVRSAMRMIQDDAQINGVFFVAPTYNQMVLEKKKLLVHMIDGSCYHAFYSPQKIQEYENFLRSNAHIKRTEVILDEKTAHQGHDSRVVRREFRSERA